MIDSAAPRRTRAVAVILATGLTVAACGSGSDEVGSAPVATADPASSASSADDASSPASGDEPDPAPVGPTAPTDAGGDGDADSGEPIVNLFPDVDVVDVADGSTVNLASRLGGGDRATLLWFWAPH